MKNLWMYLVMLGILAGMGWAGTKEKNLTYLLTHISSEEIGVQCRDQNFMYMRTVGNMAILKCTSEEKKNEKK